MVSLVTSHPSMADIGAAQDQEINLRRQLAARRFYKIGKRAHVVGASLAVAFALVSPVVLLYRPDLGPILGAIAGAWIFIARIALEPFKREQQLKGAAAQELFDCAVLGIEWNDALARQMAAAEVRSASGSMKQAEAVKGWYPTDALLPWPQSVLICQRANAVWARRQHGAYGQCLFWLAVLWGVVGIGVAISDHASLSDYLVTVALPSLPALLDAVEYSRGHREAAQSRQRLEERIDTLLQGGGASDKHLREIQDQLFVLRRDAPLVPELFYRIIRSNYEQDMHYAAGLAAARKSAHLSNGGEVLDGKDGQ